MRRLLVLAAIAFVIVLLRFVVFRPKPVLVTAYRVDRGRVEETVVNSRAGTVESRRRARMSPGTSGLVAEIPVKKGGRVREGQELLRLDTGELGPQVTLAERTLAAARAVAEEACLAAEQAGRDRERADTLAAQGLVARKAQEEATTQAERGRASCLAAREGVKQAEASLATARATLGKTVMTAPFSGVVLDVTTEVGEWITPSPPGVYIPPVIDLIDPDSLYMTAPIDEADVARVRVGLPVRISLDAFRDRSFAGLLTQISSFVETTREQNRTLEVEADFAERELPPNLLPGLSADLEIILADREDVLRIPTYAILEGDRVLVVEEGRLRSAQIETGLQNWAFTEILSGLSEGDRVVVSLDRPEVKAGARVAVSEEIEP